MTNVVTKMNEERLECASHTRVNFWSTTQFIMHTETKKCASGIGIRSLCFCYLPHVFDHCIKNHHCIVISSSKVTTFSLALFWCAEANLRGGGGGGGGGVVVVAVVVVDDDDVRCASDFRACEEVEEEKFDEGEDEMTLNFSSKALMLPPC